jgi:hypothetical protein
MIYRAELSHHDLHAGYFGGPWLKPPRHRAPAHTPGRERRRDIDRLMTELFHLGALGKEDQLGTMNLITAEKRRRAYSLVKEGGTVSLARPGQKTVVVDNPDPFIQKMTPTGLDKSGTVRFRHLHGFVSRTGSQSHGFTGHSFMAAGWTTEFRMGLFFLVFPTCQIIYSADLDNSARGAS